MARTILTGNTSTPWFKAIGPIAYSIEFESGTGTVVIERRSPTGSAGFTTTVIGTSTTSSADERLDYPARAHNEFRGTASGTASTPIINVEFQ